ncbi:hypothetical protein BM221_000132 [Beauveria bassiana]|uniref:Uncharacterized protein n=1 Tax=Beauveria bassiana TaxID=176275 RepID=A0A2N6NZL7_BEABA|nr:hypothetical protein BM221_000132 [Beauveria bassiana]
MVKPTAPSKSIPIHTGIHTHGENGGHAMRATVATRIISSAEQDDNLPRVVQDLRLVDSSTYH